MGLTTSTPQKSSPDKDQTTAMPIQSELSRLAGVISTETYKVEKYFRENGLPLPNFDMDSRNEFQSLPTPISRSRRQALQAMQELQSLMLGPREAVRWMAWDVSYEPSHFVVGELLSSFLMLMGV